MSRIKDWHQGYLDGLKEAMLIVGRQSAWAVLKPIQIEYARASAELDEKRRRDGAYGRRKVNA